MVALRLLLLLLEPCVLVRKLAQVGDRDLARDQRVVVAHVREEVVATVFEFDIESAPELFDIERCCGPVDPERICPLRQ